MDQDLEIITLKIIYGKSTTFNKIPLLEKEALDYNSEHMSKM